MIVWRMCSRFISTVQFGGISPWMVHPRNPPLISLKCCQSASAKWDQFPNPSSRSTAEILPPAHHYLLFLHTLEVFWPMPCHSLTPLVLLLQWIPPSTAIMLLQRWKPTFLLLVCVAAAGHAEHVQPFSPSSIHLSMSAKELFTRIHLKSRAASH